MLGFLFVFYKKTIFTIFFSKHASFTLSVTFKILELGELSLAQ